MVSSTVWRVASSNINYLVEQTHTFLASLNAPVIAPFLNEWPRTRERRAVEPVNLPATRWLPQAKAAAESPAPVVATKPATPSNAAAPAVPTKLTAPPSAAAPLVAELARAAPTLAWHQTYKQPAVSAAFLTNYAYTELAGLTGPIPSEHVACGFLLLGPNTTYPRHRHEAEEIYIPLAGTASWQHGDDPWRDEPPGTVIHHVSDEPHAMRTGVQPMVALYLWRSNNLNQKSRLDPAGAAK